MRQGVFRVGRDATQYRSQNTVCGILAVCAKSMGDAKKGVAGVAGVAGIFSRTARPPPKQLFDTVFEVLLIAPRDFRTNFYNTLVNAKAAIQGSRCDSVTTRLRWQFCMKMRCFRAKNRPGPAKPLSAGSPATPDLRLSDDRRARACVPAFAHGYRDSGRGPKRPFSRSSFCRPLAILPPEP